MKDLIYYDDSVSMLERTAYRVLPIIQECATKLISTNGSSNENPVSNNEGQKMNMKSVLGYLNQSEWLYLLNIGNIMQITPMTVHDLYSSTTFEVELTRDSILEKVRYLDLDKFKKDQFPFCVLLLHQHRVALHGTDGLETWAFLSAASTWTS